MSRIRMVPGALVQTHLRCCLCGNSVRPLERYPFGVQPDFCEVCADELGGPKLTVEHLVAAVGLWVETALVESQARGLAGPVRTIIRACWLQTDEGRRNEQEIDDAIPF